MTAVDARDAPAPAHRHTSTPGRSYAQTAIGSVAVLGLNLITGVLTARLLDPDGRGAVGAIVGWVLVLATVGGMGFREGLSYANSRDGSRAPAVLTAALVSSGVLGVAFVVVAEVLVPFGFSAQTSEVIDLARVFMLWVIPYIAYNSFGAVLASRHRFGLLNVQRVAQPLLYTIFLVGLWAADAVTVARVLAAHMASFVIVALLVLVLLARDSGFGPLDRPLVGEAARYGVRAHGTTIGQLANVRLDIMIMPAVLASAEIGYYVVAVSAASLVSGIFGSFDMAVFPIASRLPREEAVELIHRTARVTFFASLAVSAALAVVAPLLVELLYGADFTEGVLALRLLLPGIVMWSTASVMTGGLKALGLPQQASVAQLVGAAVTAVGLALTLRPYGIEGAAVTSSVAYTIVFLLTLRYLVRASPGHGAHVLDLRRAGADVKWLASTMTSGR